MKMKDYYINPKNVCTIGLFMNNGVYGLEINGARINFGKYDKYFIEEVQINKITKELRKYQQKIISEVENEEKERTCNS